MPFTLPKVIRDLKKSRSLPTMLLRKQSSPTLPPTPPAVPAPNIALSFPSDLLCPRPDCYEGQRHHVHYLKPSTTKPPPGTPELFIERFPPFRNPFPNINCWRTCYPASNPYQTNNIFIINNFGLVRLQHIVNFDKTGNSKWAMFRAILADEQMDFNHIIIMVPKRWTSF